MMYLTIIRLRNGHGLILVWGVRTSAIGVLLIPKLEGAGRKAGYARLF